MIQPSILRLKGKVYHEIGKYSEDLEPEVSLEEWEHFSSRNGRRNTF